MISPKPTSPRGNNHPKTRSDYQRNRRAGLTNNTQRTATHVIPSNKLMVLYILLSGITYLGLLTNNPFTTYLGLTLFVTFTSYILTWYLLVNLTLLNSQIIFEDGTIEVVIGNQAQLSVRVVSSIPLRFASTLSLLHPPHVITGVERVVINGGNKIVNITGRWVGEVYIIGGLIEVADEMGLLRVQGLLINEGIHVIIRPARSRKEGIKRGLLGYGEIGMFVEGMLGDLKALVEYDYERPASSIHWLTSARVGDLIMVSRGEHGSCPAIIMDSSSSVLIPRDGKRPIDEFLQAISDVAQRCPEVNVILVSRGYVEQRVITWNSIPSLERYVRIRIVKNHLDSAAIDIPQYFIRYLGINELAEVAYIKEELNDEATDAEIEKAHSIIGGRKHVLLLHPRVYG